MQQVAAGVLKPLVKSYPLRCATQRKTTQHNAAHEPPSLFVCIRCILLQAGAESFGCCARGYCREYRSAFQDIMGRRVVGKIVLTMDGSDDSGSAGAKL
jgi:hypothetical protein